MMKLKFWNRVLIFSCLGLSLFGGCKKPGEEGITLPFPTGAPVVKGVVKEDFVKADIVLDFGEGNTKEIKRLEAKEKTAFGLLKAAAEKEGLELDFETSDFGVFVKKIGETENSQDEFWQFWVNGQFADKAADKFEIKDGDLVEWKYEKSQF